MTLALPAGAAAASGVETVEAAETRLELTLAEAVALAIENSRTLVNARLNRTVQQHSLKVAEDKFAPDATIGPFVGADVAKDDDVETSVGMSSQVSMLLPSGGRVGAALNNSFDEGVGSSWDHSLRLSFAQPLLRGAGSSVNTASVKQARITERQNILALKSSAMSTIASVVGAYRGLFQAERRLEISMRSLERAEDLLAVNRLLIQSGRMAERDIIQTESTVASRQLDVVRGRNSLDAARSRLVDLLDIDVETRIQTAGAGIVDVADAAVPEVERSLQQAFQHRPDWLDGLLRVEAADLNVLLAGDNRRWDLTASMDATFNGNSDYRAQLMLGIPFGDLTREQQYLSASVALQQSKNQLAELRQRIRLDVRTAVREIELLLGQIELARRRRELAEQKYSIEKEKLNRGLSTNFQVATFEDDLVNAQNSEVDTNLAYLNALTSLDQKMGTMLETWRVDVTGSDGKWIENP